MKTREKIYIIVPSALLGLTLIVLILNNYILSYLPPRLLSVYPLKPCWPHDNGFHTGGVPSVTDIQFLNVKSVYHIGEPINPSLVSTTSFDVFIPRIYIQNSQNQTIWVYGGQSIQDDCSMTLHYSLQDISEPPKLDQSGQYEMFTGSIGKVASFRFYVEP